MIDRQGRMGRKGWLPEGELNDGLIVAETALANVPVLVTSDRHLLDIDPQHLSACLADSDLPRVEIAHPKDLLAATKSRWR